MCIIGPTSSFRFLDDDAHHDANDDAAAEDDDQAELGEAGLGQRGLVASVAGVALASPPVAVAPLGRPGALP